jgi:hypothetical protein
MQKNDIESFMTGWERVIKGLPMPNDLVVVLNRDADEAGDYRVMKHSEAVNNPDWTICPDIKPEDLD